MAALSTEKPFWLVQAVRRFHGRAAISVNSQELEDFVGQLRVSLREPIKDPESNGQTLVDTDSKVFLNTGSEPDTFTIKTQKTSTQETKKSYQLKNSKTNSYGIGGGINVGASFFNIGGLGASLSGSYNRTKTKETTEGEEGVRGLSQEYGIEGEIKVPPRKKVTVEIKTYAVSYVSTVYLIASMPLNATLRVRVAQGGCCGSSYVWLTARQVLRLFDEEAAQRTTGKKGKQQDKIIEDGPIAKIHYTSELQYLGERTVIHKVKEEPIIN